MCSCSVEDFLGSVDSIFLMKLNAIYHYYISNIVTHFNFFSTVMIPLKSVSFGHFQKSLL